MKQPGENKLHIMIIDDDPGTIKVLSLILSNAGHTVTAHTECGPGFLQTGSFPDLLLLDNQVGAISGADLCLQLKQEPGTAHIPVILLSGIDNLEEIARACGADDYISKPFCIKELMDKIDLLTPIKTTA